MEIDSKLGQSGSTVSIISKEGFSPELLVRKTSYEGRFSLQFEKHLEAEQNLRMSPLKVPEILENLSNNSYAMQYILSENLGEFILNHQSILVQNEIISYLNKAIGNENMNITSKNKLINYFEKKITLNYELGYIKNFDIESVVHRFSECIILNKVTEGWNHGDFSFENILVTSNGSNVFVVDFLDSPVDTPLIDFGRLYLDLSLGWWNSNKKINELNSQIERFKVQIESLILEKGLHLEVLKLFALFACVRIMPYTKNPVRLGFLKSYFHEMMK
jgi:serine/threonine protein kinase